MPKITLESFEIFDKGILAFVGDVAYGTRFFPFKTLFNFYITCFLQLVYLYTQVASRSPGLLLDIHEISFLHGY